MTKQAQIGLGTVQLGLPYGNKASSQIMPTREAFEILQLAVDQGVIFYDTAIAYGESEARIGEFDLAHKSPAIQISTKIPSVPEELWKDERQYWTYIVDQTKASAARLKISKHNLLQFHQCDVGFLSHKNTINTFERLLNEEICCRIGVSVYSPDQAEAAIAIGHVSTLQVPVNIIDRRFVDKNFIDKIKKSKIDLIARTAVLQGVLIPGAPLPEVKKRTQLSKLRQLAEAAASKLSKTPSLESAAFRFLFGNHGKNINFVLIGVDSIHTLRHNLTLIKNSTESLSSDDLRQFNSAIQFAVEHDLLNPGTWNL